MKSLPPTTVRPSHTTQHSRREFLAKTALLTGGILAFGLPAPIRPTSTAMAARGVAPSLPYVLELNGGIVGPITSIDSGFTSGQVRENLSYQSPFPHKSLAMLLHEDISLQCGTTMEPAFYVWIQRALEGLAPRGNGRILDTSSSSDRMDRISFSSALLTEVAFPTLDRSANIPVTLGLTIKPGSLSYGNGGSDSLPADHQFRPWQASNFRLRIDGLEQACAYVVRIESLVWKQTTSQAGHSSNPGLFNAGPIQTPNLVVTLPQAQAEPFTEWFYQFVIAGQNGEDSERPGLLEYLGPDLQTLLFELSFGHLGIFRMSPVPPSQTNPVPMVKVEMYCETMHLTQIPEGASQQGAPTQPASSRQKPTSKAPVGSPPRSKALILPKKQIFTPRLP